MTFEPIDPLEFKSAKVNDAALGALKREISNILSSYVGWYDPFCELIQNSLDSVEARRVAESNSGSEGNYTPRINVIIDLVGNSLTISDNGVGLDKDKFEQFLAPNFSFKSGKTRGHKGVGATYVAYGFNYMRVSTKIPGFSRSGKIVGARNWLKDQAPSGNPKIEHDDTPYIDADFDGFDRGVSISVRFDDSTHPRRLDWIKADDASKWAEILSIKTGLGSIIPDTEVNIKITVVADKKVTVAEPKGTGYLWLHKGAGKKASAREINAAAKALFDKFGPGRALPDKYRNLDFIYDNWTAAELADLVGGALDAEGKEVLAKYSPTVSVEFGYTAKLWGKFNDSLQIRSNYRILNAGIQLAANNMPQGETILIPLTRNIGRQNQLHFLIHFDNYSPDMGRKGFHRELTDFAKDVSRHITENHLSKLRTFLKANTGVAPDLVRQMKIGDWKKEMLTHEEARPLVLQSSHFFKPTERISVTSAPTREQDVIALFNQMVAGGVIRGISMMSTNERFTYDGLFKVTFDLPVDIYTYNPPNNPLGVSRDIAEALHGKVTEPLILEYKYSLDGLIEDLDSHDKNISDLNLCVAWETGSLYTERYGITSFLIPENADQRQYHGVTHGLTDLESGAPLCDLIILSELIKFLNDPDVEAEKQRKKYE